jgi:hypothetical protein
VELHKDDLDHDRQLTRSRHEVHGGEDNHLATAMDPWSRGDYSLITPEAGKTMKKASGDDSPLWQGVGKSFWILPNSGQQWRRLPVLFVDRCSGLMVFPMK